jgi:hypothetical protein
MNERLAKLIVVTSLSVCSASAVLTQATAQTVKKLAEEGKELLDKNADRGPGVRVGAGLRPEQFVIGFRFGIEPKKPPRLVPSIDFGFGDNMTTIAFNFDFIWRLRVEGTTRVIYGGAGPTVAFMNPQGDGSNWEPGLTVVAGMRLSSNFKRPLNVEARFGSGGIPDVRVLLVIGL